LAKAFVSAGPLINRSGKKNDDCGISAGRDQTLPLGTATRLRRCYPASIGRRLLALPHMATIAPSIRRRWPAGYPPTAWLDDLQQRRPGFDLTVTVGPSLRPIRSASRVVAADAL
jgi:hypothetical protein